MTQRDKKTMLVVVLSLVGAGIAFYALNSLFLSPVNAYSRKIEDLELKIDQTNGQILEVVKGREDLKKAQERSLPVDQTNALSEYYGYLTILLDRNGLKDVNLKPDEIRTPVGATNQPNAAKKPAHTIMTVTVNAKGTLAAVVHAMDELQRTPVMHRIKSFTLGHQESTAKGKDKDSLNLTLTMEAMIVAGADAKKVPVWTANKSLPLPTSEHPRTYAKIAEKNIFLGPVPKDIPDDSPILPDPILDVTKELVTEYMRLVQCDAENQEAFMRQLLFKDRDTRIRTNDKAYNTFQVISENGEPVLKAHVLRIDQRDMYIQVKDDVYAIHIGRTVSDGMRIPINDAELKRLDLLKLLKPYDPKTDKADAAKDKTGKTSKKGKGQ